MKRLRVIFFGTPAFALPTLEAIQRSRHTLVAVVTQPDRPRGRGQRLTPSPVKARAIELGVPVLQPERLRDDAFSRTFASLDSDIGVVAAYGKLLPAVLLDIPTRGMINVHGSLLPRWRGAAPVHRAILAGDHETGVTIMRIVPALDAGPTMAQVTTIIDPNETSAELGARLAAIGAPLLVDVLDRLAAGPVVEVPQDESAVTYADRLDRRERDLDWSQPAQSVHDHIRGLQPWPLAATRLHGRRLILLASEISSATPSTPTTPGIVLAVDSQALSVATGSGTIRLLRVQLEGRSPMTVRDFLSGYSVRSGDRFEPLAPVS